MVHVYKDVLYGQFICISSGIKEKLIGVLSSLHSVGWIYHFNNIIFCHYPFTSPDACSIQVGDDDSSTKSDDYQNHYTDSVSGPLDHSLWFIIKILSSSYVRKMYILICHCHDKVTATVYVWCQPSSIC